MPPVKESTKDYSDTLLNKGSSVDIDFILGRNSKITDETKKCRINLKTDTTNYAKDFPKVAAYQKRKFGVVGWYDYNCFKRFGCKWDAQLCKPSISQARLTKKYVISFEVETPWSYPQLWMEQIKAKTGCEVYIASIEESDMWLFWSEVDGDEHSYSPKLEEKAKELADDDYDGYWEFRENLYECAVSDCVCEVCELLQ